MTDRTDRSGRRLPSAADCDATDAGRVWTLATVTGTSGLDFIHRAGDGLTAPPGYTDIAQATTGDDVIDGGKGKDIIYGDAGNDVIIGGGGSDHLYGGAGRDEFRVTNAAQIDDQKEYIDGGESGAYLALRCSGFIDLTLSTIIAVDVIDLLPTEDSSLDVVMTGAQFAGFSHGIIGSQSSSITLSNSTHVETANITILSLGFINGSEYDDSLHLLGVIDDDHLKLSGGGGDDDLYVRDSLKSGYGRYDNLREFTIDGGDGNDVLQLYDGEGTLTGDAGDDLIIGGKLRDTINGGDGDDILDGGGRGDTLTGGSGADLFVYTDPKHSKLGIDTDTITDFSHAAGDRIDLSKIDADTTQPDDQPFHLVSGGAFTGHAGELIQIADGNGDTVVQGDVNGDGQADFAIALNHLPTLVEADFVL